MKITSHNSYIFRFSNSISPQKSVCNGETTTLVSNYPPSFGSISTITNGIAHHSNLFRSDLDWNSLTKYIIEKFP